MYKLTKLTKLSVPGRVKGYETVEKLTEEVSSLTCNLCKDVYGATLESMLASDCGCECEVEGLARNSLSSFSV